jgi:hypothetical protein
VVVSFIGGGNRRKPPTTCRKSLKTETFFVDIKQTVCERVQFNLAYLTKKSTDKEKENRTVLRPQMHLYVFKCAYPNFLLKIILS